MAGLHKHLSLGFPFFVEVASCVAWIILERKKLLYFIFNKNCLQSDLHLFLGQGVVVHDRFLSIFF
jgi:hypothetical protein